MDRMLHQLQKELEFIDKGIAEYYAHHICTEGGIPEPLKDAYRARKSVFKKIVGLKQKSYEKD